MALDEEKPVDRRRFFRLGIVGIACVLWHRRPNRWSGWLTSLASSISRRRMRPEVWLRRPARCPKRNFSKLASAMAIASPPVPVQSDQARSHQGRRRAVYRCRHIRLRCLHRFEMYVRLPERAHCSPHRSMTSTWARPSGIPPRCLRTSGESCTICVDKCPLGSAAIELKAGQRRGESPGLHRLRRLPTGMSDIAEKHCRDPDRGEDGVRCCAMMTEPVGNDLAYRWARVCPVQVSNCAAAWRTNISTPPIVFAPLCLRLGQQSRFHRIINRVEDKRLRRKWRLDDRPADSHRSSDTCRRMWC